MEDVLTFILHLLPVIFLRNVNPVIDEHFKALPISKHYTLHNRCHPIQNHRVDVKPIMKKLIDYTSCQLLTEQIPQPVLLPIYLYLRFIVILINHLDDVVLREIPFRFIFYLDTDLFEV